uniref:Uncharacterized protein n=1 Tax=Romanomermis culicivorax TaxID=13658 RepID=A0A915HX77_ROMCU
AVAFLARLTLDDAGDGTLQQRLAIQRQHKRSASVVLVESLALPLVSRLLGDLLFKTRTANVFYRTALGAAAFLTLRCVCRVYLNYRQLGRQTKRQILDYYNGGHSRQGSATIN